ncbi:SGNH/GDSL hydrolase family protein, partial [Pseudarthrobacter sp. MDT1-22]
KNTNPPPVRHNRTTTPWPRFQLALLAPFSVGVNTVAGKANVADRLWIFNDTAAAWARSTAALLKARQGQPVRMHTMGNSLFAGPAGSGDGSVAGIKDFQAWLRAELQSAMPVYRGGDYPGGSHWWLNSIAGTPSPLTTDGRFGTPIYSTSYYKFTVTGQTVTFKGYPCSGIRLWFAAGAGTGTVSVTVDSETTVTGVGSTAGGVRSVDVLSTRGFGAHSFSVTWGAGTAYLLGVEAIVPGLSVSDGGVPSSSAVDWTATAAGFTGPTFNGSAGLNPDMSLILLQTNEWNAQTVVSTYQTQLTSVVTPQLAAQGSTGAVVLCIPPRPSGNPSTGSEAAGKTWADYSTATKAVATAQGLPVLDFTALFGGSWNSTLMADQLHWNAAGQSVAGRSTAHAYLGAENKFSPTAA